MTDEALADDVSAEGEEGGKGKRKLPLKLVLFVAAPLLLLGGGAGAAWYFGLFGGDAETAVAPIEFHYFELPEMTVNLSSGTGRSQFLKLRVALELEDEALTTVLRPALPRVMDTFQVYLRELRPTDIDGSAGLYRLREELVRRINIAIAPNRINDVLFQEILIQ